MNLNFNAGKSQWSWGLLTKYDLDGGRMTKEADRGSMEQPG